MAIPKEVKNVIEKLQKAGFEAYICGGFVPDFFLGKKRKNWGVTQKAKPEKI